MRSFVYGAFRFTDIARGNNGHAPIIIFIYEPFQPGADCKWRNERCGYGMADCGFVHGHGVCRGKLHDRFSGSEERHFCGIHRVFRNKTIYLTEIQFNDILWLVTSNHRSGGLYYGTDTSHKLIG